MSLRADRCQFWDVEDKCFSFVRNITSAREGRLCVLKTSRALERIQRRRGVGVDIGTHGVRRKRSRV